MILINAVPLKRGPLYDYHNKHFINPNKIVVAVFDDTFKESEQWVNVILEDNSEWQIKRADFNEMVISTDAKGN